MVRRLVFAAFVSASLICASAQGATLLYQQNFESPVNFVNDGGDFNIFRTVNQLYANQPAGFAFAQDFTVETLRIGGTEAFGQGYKDPQGVGGQYVLGMLSTFQNDRLGLAFNVGTFKFLNFRVDISSIDLDRQGGPFVPVNGAAPLFRFRLFDNPTGALSIGAGTPLSSFDANGVIAANKFTFNWTNVLGALDATGNTNGNVILQVDLISGGYAAFDNFIIAASDISGEVPGTVIPLPPGFVLMAGGMLLLGGAARRSRSARR